MKKPEKKLHTHDSIPGYFGGLEDNCIICICNKMVDDYEKFLPSETEIYQIILQIKDRNLDSMDEFIEEMKVAHAIAKRIGVSNDKRKED